MNPIDPQLASNLRPVHIVDLARSRSREDFVVAIDRPLLVVPVPDPSSDLARALGESASLSGPPIEPSSGGASETTIGTMSTLRIEIGAYQARPAFSARHLRMRLSRALHWVAPLHKRVQGGRTLSGRITVGRAPTSDIILHHPTVSKLHAWFERDENHVFYVADAESANSTRLNGVALRRRAPTAVGSGDELRFGDVTVTVCTPEVLWDALTSAGAAAGDQPPASTRGG
jgi:hypothetical protein